MWVLGGLAQDAATPAVYGYDPAIDTWTRGPDLPLQLHHLAAVTYRDELVVIGGWAPANGNLSGLVSGKVFALRNGAWVELAPLTHPRVAHAAAVVGDKIVVVGGQADNQLIAPTEVFDGTKWTDAAPIPTPREHLSATTDGTYVYAVGGRNLSSDKNTAAFERFDPATGAWQTMPNMPPPRGVRRRPDRRRGRRGAHPRVAHRRGVRRGHRHLVAAALAAGAAARHLARDPGQLGLRGRRRPAPHPRQVRRDGRGPGLLLAAASRVAISETASPDFPHGESRLS